MVSLGVMCLRGDFAPAERVGQGEVGGVDGKHVALVSGCS